MYEGKIHLYLYTNKKQWLASNQCLNSLWVLPRTLLLYNWYLSTACLWHGQMTPSQATMAWEAAIFNTSQWWSDGRVPLPHSARHCWVLEVLPACATAKPSRSPLISFSSNRSYDGLCYTDTNMALPRLCCSNSSKRWSNIILKYYNCS